MSARQNFLSAHWEWLVLLVGLLALAGAGALYALALGDADTADAYAQQLGAMRPAHEGVAAADLAPLQKALRGAKSPAQLVAVDPKKANFLASERRVLCRAGDETQKAKACGRPIRSDLEKCPFCGTQQKVVKVEVDTDHDGMPNAWEVKHGFNPNDAADAAKDADGDGFTNLEECQAGTDPRDAKSHPDYLEFVSVSGALRQTTLPFYFNAVNPIPGGHRFTFQRHGVKGFNAKVGVKLNEEVASGKGPKDWKSGWVVTAYEQKSEMRKKAGTTMKTAVDVSTVTVKRVTDGKTLTIRINERTIAVEQQATLHYAHGKGQDIVVSEGAEFKIAERAYRVLKLKAVNGACEATVLDLTAKKEKILH